MEEGTDYAEVLKEAQDLGYAEVRAFVTSPA
jgi:homoserine dehydrogenase